MKVYFSILFVFVSIIPNAQRNCNVYKTDGDNCRYEACMYLEKAPTYFQLRREFHEVYDEALEICPNYGDAYRAKSVAYLKTGGFITWKRLMDKAVSINPEDNLGYRGWCKFQFLRDYKGALEDILRLEAISKYDIGYSQNGMYHLKIAKALCYKMLGNKEKAIEVIENHLKEDYKSLGLYDYLHLGVLYQVIGNYEKSLSAFHKQSEEYDCAENAYYTAMSYKRLNDNNSYKLLLEKADSLYLKNRIMTDPYTHQVDKVFYSKIENEIKSSIRK